MPAPRVLPTITPGLTGAGSGGTYDETLSPVFTKGLILKNRNPANAFFIGDAEPVTVFATVEPGQRVIVDGDGTPRKVRFFLGGTAGDILEFLTLDDRDT